MDMTFTFGPSFKHRLGLGDIRFDGVRVVMAQLAYMPPQTLPATMETIVATLRGAALPVAYTWVDGSLGMPTLDFGVLAQELSVNAVVFYQDFGPDYIIGVVKFPTMLTNGGRVRYVPEGNVLFQL